jgi:hypothetical protein
LEEFNNTADRETGKEGLSHVRKYRPISLINTG